MLLSKILPNVVLIMHMINCQKRKYQFLIMCNYLCGPNHILWFQTSCVVHQCWGKESPCIYFNLDGNKQKAESFGNISQSAIGPVSSFLNKTNVKRDFPVITEYDTLCSLKEHVQLWDFSVILPRQCVLSCKHTVFVEHGGYCKG